MKLLHVITSLKIGGAETLLIDLAQELQKKGFNQKIIFFHDGPNRSKLEKLNIESIQIKGLFFKYDPIFLLRLFLVLKNEFPNVVHSWLWSSNFLSSLFCKILKIKQVSAVHSVFNKTGVAKNSFLKTLLDKAMLNLSGKVVFVSYDMKRQFVDFHSSYLINKKSVVIQNGVKVIPAKKIDNSKHFIIGSVGRFIPLKNHQLLIKMMKKIVEKENNIKLWLIGYGPLENDLKSLVQKLNLENSVSFIKSNKPQEYYSKMDCFVLPSDQEGLSIALLEAMSYGVIPIVASDNKEHDVVRDSVNGIVQKCSAEKFYESVLSLYCNKDLRQRLSSNSISSINEKFSLDLMVKKYINVYNNL